MLPGCVGPPAPSDSETTAAVRESDALTRDQIESLVDTRVRLSLAHLEGKRRLVSGRARLVQLASAAGDQALTLAAAPGSSGATGEADESRAAIDALAARIDALGAQLADANPAALDLDGLEDRVVSSIEELRAIESARPDQASLLAQLSGSLERIRGVVGQVGEIRNALEELQSVEDGNVVDARLDPWNDGWGDDWTVPGNDGETSPGEHLMKVLPATFQLPDREMKPFTAGVAAVSLSSHPAVRVELQSVRRSAGGTVTLKFALINGGEIAINIAQESLFGNGYDWRISNGVFLADPGSRTRFDVVMDGGDEPMCSRGSSDTRYLNPGERRDLWARFPAPPGPTVSVHFTSVPPFDGVPVDG